MGGGRLEGEVKDKINIVGFALQSSNFAIVNMKASINTYVKQINGRDFIPTTFYVRKQVAGWISPPGSSVPTSAVEEQFSS